MNIEPNLKAVIYCRVSSKEQEETGYSLPAQEKFLRDYAEKNGFDVAKAFSVSESARGKTVRKIFNKMMEFAEKNKITVIIVETTDRLTRNFADVPIIDDWIMKDENYPKFRELVEKKDAYCIKVQNRTSGLCGE